MPVMISLSFKPIIEAVSRPWPVRSLAWEGVLDSLHTNSDCRRGIK